MDCFGLLKDYLDTSEVPNVIESGDGVDYEYNWHPVFMTQESHCDSVDLLQKDDSDDYDFSGLFEDLSDVKSAKNYSYEPLVVNQRMDNSSYDKSIAKYQPVVEEISDDETDKSCGNGDFRYFYFGLKVQIFYFVIIY